MHPLIVIGTGLAGYGLAREWRKLDRTTPLCILTSDDGSFYSKPMLSNALSAGRTAQDLANRCASDMARELAAEITPHCRVESIDAAKRLIRANGTDIPYSRLVLALGADPIRLPLSGDGAEKVLSINDLADYAKFRMQLQGKRHVSILGAGLIGCEFANDLLAGRYEVSIVDPGSRPLVSLLPPEAASPLWQALRERGAAWHFGAKAEAVERTAAGLRLTLSDGSALATDLVLSAVGLRPRTRIAASAGIAVNRGIVVDNRLATSAADVYAIGDCAEAQGRVLPFVLPLMQQARTLAALLAGAHEELAYPAMPVVVKTPACPVVASPPPPNLAGAWRCESRGQAVRALYHGDDGVLRGFALTGEATAEKTALARQLG